MTRACLALSLGFILLVLESDRMSALMYIDRSGGTSVASTLITIGALAACTAVLCARPPRRLVPVAWAALAALCCSLGLGGVYFLDAGTISQTLCDIAYSVARVALLFCWVQRAMPLGRTSVIQGFGVGAIALGCLSALTAALAHPVAMTLMLASPIAGCALLFAAGAEREPGASRDDRATSADNRRWNALGAIAAASAPRGASAVAEPGGRLRSALLPLLKLAPFLCYAVIFGNVHFAWIELQDGSVGLWVQLGAAVGSALCGAAALSLARLRWGRAFESIMHLLVTALALMAMWLSASLTSEFVFAYLVLLNVAQKLAFLLILTFGFPFARDARQCTSLWALAYLSFLAGTCVSYLVSNSQVVTTLNGIAAAALAVVLAVDVLNIAQLYGTDVRPGGGDAPQRQGDADARPDDACAGQGEPSDATGERRPSPGFGELPYTCHLFATQYDLTRREEEILLLLARGRTTARISETLCISNATTRTHLRNIYAKMGVHSHQDILDLFEPYEAPRDDG